MIRTILHSQIATFTCASDEKTHNPTDRGLIGDGKNNLCPAHDKDLHLVTEKVRKRLSVSKRELQKSDMEKFSFKKLRNALVRV
jgi:hypothetical protein